MSSRLDFSDPPLHHHTLFPAAAGIPTMARNASDATPTRPSLLCDELVEATRELKIRKIEELTPPDPDELVKSSNKNTQHVSAVTTPPDSKRRGPVIVNGSTNRSSPPSLQKSKTLCPEPKAEDDVFVSTPSLPEASAEVVSTFSANQSGPNEVAQRIESSMNTEGYNGFVPREDRRQQPPSAANAQGLYPPDALVFVANLSNQRTEDQLELSCHQAFDAFGQCHIKVRHDKNKQPFCFVQFEQIEDANDAINRGNGMVIDGRSVRLERAKAERAVIISKEGKNFVSEAEARHLLEQYGSIEIVRPITLSDSHQHGLPPGAWVKFAYYLDCRDALRAFQDPINEYRLQIAHEVEPRMRIGLDGSPVFQGFRSARSPVDMKSIFVGNLPEETTKEELTALFLEFGQVVQTNVIRKHFAENVVNIFGFVEFSNPQEADYAARAEKSLRGLKLRIEPKEYSARRQYRHSFSPSPPINRVPRRNAEPYFANNARIYGFVNHSPQYFQMTQTGTPPHPYNPMHTSTYHHHGYHNGYETPPSMSRFIPMGLFSATPPQMQYHGPPPSYGTPQAPPSYGNYMQTINETAEDERFGGH